MKRLVRSTKTGIFCIQCEKLIPVNTSRIIDGQMHSCLGCVNKSNQKGSSMKVTLKPMETAPHEVEILAWHKRGGNFHPVKLRGDKVVMRWHDEYSQHKNHFTGWVDMPTIQK